MGSSDCYGTEQKINAEGWWWWQRRRRHGGGVCDCDQFTSRRQQVGITERWRRKGSRRRRRRRVGLNAKIHDLIDDDDGVIYLSIYLSREEKKRKKAGSERQWVWACCSLPNMVTLGWVGHGRLIIILTIFQTVFERMIKIVFKIVLVWKYILK